MNDLLGFRVLVAASTWLLTCVVHGVVAQGLALIAAPALVRAPRLRGMVWKAALLLPIVTATVATLGWRPVVNAADVNIPELLRSHAPATRERVWLVERGVRQSGGITRSDSFATTSRAVNLAALIVALAIALAATTSVRLVWRRRALRRRIGERVEIRAHAGELACGVRLTASATIGAPVALHGREICVPAAMFEQLAPEERRSILAHEAAHLERHDPFWFALADLGVALLPWQPFARLVVRAMRRDAEFCCDDVVVATLGDGRPLARSLAAFAASFDPAETAMAASSCGSPLEMRVRRILGPMPRPARRVAALAAIGLVVATAGIAVAMPVVSTRLTTLREPARDHAAGIDERVILLEREVVR